MAHAYELRDRTKRFAFSVVNLVKVLPQNIAADAIARQLIRSGTGMASNYRSACRARSKREFIARLGIALEEADETELWLEALKECSLTTDSMVHSLRQEAGELRAIFLACIRTARSHQ